MYLEKCCLQSKSLKHKKKYLNALDSCHDNVKFMKKNVEMRFIKPERSIIKKSNSWLYKNPIAGIFYWNRLRSVFNLLKKKRWKLILEIGCEYGFLLPSLCQISDRVIGSDIKSNFEFCKKVTLKDIKKKNANLELKVADATRLSDVIPENSCDVVVAVSVLEHINEYDRAIEEIHKCLKPDGIFVCVLPSENMLYKFIKNLLRYVSVEFREHYTPHSKEYDPNRIEASLRARFEEYEELSCPLGLPLFIIKAYRKKEGAFEGNNVN